MNSVERVLAAMEFRPVDRVPTIPLVMRYAAQLAGMPYSTYLRDPRALVEAQLGAQARFGYDYVTVCSDGYREAEACGAELSFPHDSTPKVERPTLESPEDLDRLTVPDPTKAARMKDRVESIRQFHAAVGGEVLILGWVEGPFAAAAAMYGLENLLVALHVDLPFVHRLLEYALAVETAFAAAQVDAGAELIGVGDAAASLIRPEHYRDVALPFEQRLFEGIHRTGAKAKLHICGNTTHLLPFMPRSGADAINLDWMVDLKASREACPRTCLKGNMDPVQAMLLSTPEAVRERSLADIAIGSVGEGASRTGYILGLGCEVAPDTPEDNLLALVEAAHES